MMMLDAGALGREPGPGRVLYRVNRLVLRYVESRFADTQPTLAQWLALQSLDAGGATTAGQLARDMGVTTGATTRLIDGLESNGWVQRGRGPADRRVVNLTLTESGRAKYREKEPLVRGCWNELLTDFDAAELRDLTRLLTKLLNSFDRRGAEGARRGRSLDGTPFSA